MQFVHMNLVLKIQPSSLHTSICVDKHLKKLHHQHFVQMSSCWVCKVATNAIFTFIHQKESFHLDNRVRLVVVGSIVSIYVPSIYIVHTNCNTLCDMYNISTTYFCLIGWAQIFEKRKTSPQLYGRIFYWNLIKCCNKVQKNNLFIGTSLFYKTNLLIA